MSTFRNEGLTYLDTDGLFAPFPFPQTTQTGGNMLKDLGLFIIMLGLRGELQQEDIEHFNNTVRNCYVENKIGLLNRNPLRPDQESHDDYKMITIASNFCDSIIANEIRDNNKGYRDNVSDGKIYWGGFFVRFLDIPPIFNLSATGKISWWDKLRLWIYFKFTNTQDGSQVVLDWGLVKLLEKYNVLNSSTNSWKNKTNIKNMFIQYYGEQHIFSKEIKI